MALESSNLEIIKDTVLKLVEKYNTRNPFEIADYLDMIIQKMTWGNIQVTTSSMKEYHAYVLIRE